MRYEKTTQVIAYLVNHAPEGADCTKLSLLKLLFLADRYSLRMYGQALTDDSYVAMKLGPVPSKSKELIEGYAETKEQQDYFYSYLTVRDWEVNATARTYESQYFCDFDIDVLDAVLKVWASHPTAQELVEYTHRFPEWKEHEAKALAGKLSTMRMGKFFQPAIPDDYCPADEERLSVSKSLWNRNKRIQKSLA